MCAIGQCSLRLAWSMQAYFLETRNIDKNAEKDEEEEEEDDDDDDDDDYNEQESIVRKGEVERGK